MAQYIDDSHPDLSESDLNSLLQTASYPSTDKVPLSNLAELFKVPEDKQNTYATFTESFERYKVKVDVFKWLIGTVGLTLITFIINWGFRDREQGMSEIAQYDKYTSELIVLNDNPVNRRMLAQFFSHVTPSEKLKCGWKTYYNEVNGEYLTFLKNDSLAKTRLVVLNKKDSINLTEAEKAEKVEVENFLEENKKLQNAPIIIPDKSLSAVQTIYIQSVSMNKTDVEGLRSMLNINGFMVPAIEFMDKAKYGNLDKNEIRYFRDVDWAGAQQIQMLLHDRKIETQLKYIPNLSSKTQKGTIELWLK